MKKEKKTALVTMRVIKLLHFILIIILFAAAWNYISPDPESDILIYALYALCELFLLRTFNAYYFEYSGKKLLILSQLIAEIIGAAVVYFIALAVWHCFFGPGIFLLIIAAQLIINAVFTLCAVKIMKRLIPPKKVLVIYGSDSSRERLREAERLLPNYEISAFCASPSSIEEVAARADDASTFLLSGIAPDMQAKILEYCAIERIPVFYLPGINDILTMSGSHVQSLPIPLMRIYTTDIAPEYAIIKRCSDILISLLGLIVFSPLCLITAALIKLDDGGPVIYRQVRLTKDRREFNICKFRSMSVDAEKDGVARLSAGKDDDRVTRVGRFIRMTRIDELPQLWNVLKGDMSIVGPRPERPELAEKYEKAIPSFSVRYCVKAGLTGYAQVYGRYNTSPGDKLRMDLLYISKMDPLLDIRLMLSTVITVFRPDSTQGVSPEEQDIL